MVIVMMVLLTIGKTLLSCTKKAKISEKEREETKKEREREKPKSTTV